MTRRKSTPRAIQLLALVFALLMATSVLAPLGGAAGAADGEATPVEYDVDGDVVETELSNSIETNDLTEADVSVDDAVVEADGTVEVIVRVDELEEPLAAETSDAAVDELQRHAAESQRPVVEYAAETDGVEVKNRFWITNAVLLELDRNAVDVDEIAAQPGVTDVHANFEVEVPSPVEGDDADAAGAGEDAETADYDTTYGLEQINAPDVWDEYDTMGGGAEIAVLDTGVDPDHPDIDIADENWAEFDSEGNQVDSEPHDTAEHGTHVSGTVVGGDASGEHIGVAPEATLMHGMVLEGGSGSFAQIAGGIEWAVDEDADAISMSLGAEGYYEELIDPVRNARDAGVVVVSSSGNEGAGSSGSPGNVYEAFAVGASDEGEDIASFSSGEEIDTDQAWGTTAPDDWPDEYVVPNVAAPGVDVKSAVPGGGYDDTYSGTSMAAPHVSGTVALMVGASGGSADAAEIEDALEETAWKPDGEDDEQDIRYGHGIIDAQAAVADVAVESGVSGTVTDAETGDAVADASVELEESGFATSTDDDGEYTLRAGPGNDTLVADAFGYGTAAVDVEVPDDETFVEQDLELEPEFAAELEADQPDEILSGDSITAEIRAGNVEAITVDNVGDFDEADATLYVDGEAADFGETVSLDRFSGTLEIEVETASGQDGELELEHALEGLNESATLETGPTFVWAEPHEVGVVAHEADDHAEAFADSIVDASALYDPTVITTEQAAAEPDAYDVLVVHSLGNDVADLDAANELFDATTEHQVGVVVMDQQGSGADAITRLSEARGYPEVVDYPSSFLVGAPSWYADIDDPDHELWEDVTFDNITTAPPDFVRTEETELSSVWWDGFDGDTEAVAGQYLLGSAPSVGTDDPRGTTLLGSYGYTGSLAEGDYTENMYTMLDNALERGVAADEAPVFLTGETRERVDPGETIEAEFDVEDVEEVKTSLTDDSTIDEDDLDLYHGTTVNDFDQWRAFDPPRTEDGFAIQVDTPEDAPGIVELEHTFRVAQDDGTTEEFVVTTRQTSVYDPPLEVSDDAETIGEAIDMAVPHAEIVVENGTYEEQVVVPFDQSVYNVTIRGEEGSTPTITAPDDLGPDNGTIEIQAMHTTVENLHVEGHQIDDRFYGIVSGVTAGDVDTDHTTIRNVSVDGVDVGIQFGGLLAGSDSNHGHIDNVEVTDTHIGIIAGTPPDETFITDAGDTTIENSYVEDADYGILGDSRHSDDVVIRNNTVVDVERGIGQDGNNNAEIVGNEIHGADVGIYNERGQIGDYEHNVITDAEIGISLEGDDFGGYRVIDINNNEIEADTGIYLGDQGWLSHLPHPVWIHYNDLEATDVAVENEREQDAMAPVDARLNWHGEDGNPTSTYLPENEVIDDPYLTERPEDVDQDEPRAFGTGLDLEADTGYALGVPGPVAGDVEDVFGTDFEGVVYGFDAESQSWEQLKHNDGLDTLEGLYVKPSEDAHVTMSFYHGDGVQPIPGQTTLEEGWNFVTAPQLTGAEDAYAIGSADPALALGVFDRPHTDFAAEQSELEGTYVFGADEDGPTVSPFEGAFLYSESDGTLAGQLHHNPSLDELYDRLDVEDRSEEAILTGDAAPEDVADIPALEGDAAREVAKQAALGAAVEHEPRSEYALQEIAVVAETAAAETAFATGLSEDEIDAIVQEVLERVTGEDLENPSASVDYTPLPSGVVENAAVDEVEPADTESADETTADAAADAEYQVAYLDGMPDYFNAGPRMVEELEPKMGDEFDIEPVHATTFFDDLDASLDEYDIVVVNDFRSEVDIDDEAVEEFIERAERPDVGVVYLDQEPGTRDLAIEELSEIRGDPGERDGETFLDEVYVEITEDHAVFDGVGTAGDEVTIVDSFNPDMSWFDEYDGDVHADVGDVDDGIAGAGVGIDEARTEVLLSSFAFSGFVVDFDFEDEAFQTIANAVEVVEPYDPVVVAEQTPKQVEPGDAVEGELQVTDMEAISVDVADESTLDEDDLDLYLNGSVNAFGEWRSYDPTVTDDEYTISVETDEDVVGTVTLDVTVDSTVVDDDFELTLGPTAVYEPPLTVGDDVDTVQEAVDIAPDDERTIYVQEGTYNESVTVETPKLTVTPVEGDDVTISADGGPAVTVDADDVTLEGVDLESTDDAHGIVAGNVSDVAVSDVTVSEAATGVAVQDGSDATVTNVTVMDAATGVGIQQSDDASVGNVTVMNAGEAVSATDTTNVSVTDLYGSDVDTGVAATDSHVVLDGATIDDAGTGVDLEASEGVVTNATVSGDTGVALADLADDDVWLRFNDLSDVDVGIESDLDDTFDARLNYLGHGTATTAIEGDVTHSPVLTAPPEAVDREDVTDIGVELLVEGGESTAIGVPGHTTQTIGEVFDDDFEGTAYGFDAATQSWEQIHQNDELGALDGLLIVAETDGHAVFEFRDDGPSAPGTADLEEGWNLVGAPMYTDAETAFQVGSTEYGMAVDLFETPAGQIGPAGELDEPYVFDSGADAPDVSPFEGYFLHVEEDGTVPSYLHSDVTLEDLYALLGLDPAFEDEGVPAELTDEDVETSGADERPSVDPAAFEGPATSAAGS